MFGLWGDFRSRKKKTSERDRGRRAPEDPGQGAGRQRGEQTWKVTKHTLAGAERAEYPAGSEIRTEIILEGQRVSANAGQTGREGGAYGSAVDGALFRLHCIQSEFA